MSINKLTTATPQAATAGKVSRALRVLTLAFAALAAGSRAIPLGDNGTIIRELAARAGRAATRTGALCGTDP